MPDDDITCPLCGNKSKAGTAKCAVCGTELGKTRQRKVRDRSARAKTTGDLLRKEIPKLEIPEAKLSCPFCAVELKGGEAKCPRCSVPLSSAPPKTVRKGDEEFLECPDCGKLAPVGSKKCPDCGVGFEEVPVAPPPAPPPAEELPPPPEPVPAETQVAVTPGEKAPSPPQEPKVEPAPEPAPPPSPEPVPAPKPEPPPKEVVTAVTPSSAKVEGGFINGMGASTDRGFVNGTGLVNGTGKTNGTKEEIRLSQAGARQRSFLMRWQFLAVIVAVVVVISAFAYLSYFASSEGLAVDGEFDDWKGVDKYGAYLSSGSSSIDIEEWAVQVEDNSLYAYLKVPGYLMDTSDVESFFLFVDRDGSDSTGYSISGMGADYLLQLDGWEGEIKSAVLNEYGTFADIDWSAWSYVREASSSLGVNELEASVSLPSGLGSDARFMMVSQDHLAHVSATYPVPASGGVLVVRQQLGPAVSQAMSSIPASESVALLKLTFTCEGAEGEVTSVSPIVTGASLAWPFERFTISPGQTRSVDVTVDTSDTLPGTMVSASVSASVIGSSFSSLMVLGDGVKVYVSSPPEEISIDGAFGDWAGLVTMDYEPISVVNPNIDITGVSAVNATESLYFFVSVAGEICAGSLVPVIIGKPVAVSGGGGEYIPVRKTGEDVLRIFIDSDLSYLTGFRYSISTKIIGADYLLEVTGLYGKIVSKSLLVYSAGNWVPVDGAALGAAKDTQRLEMSIGASSMGAPSSISFIVETTDWLQHTDVATSIPIDAKSTDDMLVTAASLRSWYIENPTTSPTATSMSYQRKLFYDGANFWSFYWNGADTVYRHSSDYGVTWSSTSVAFKTTGVNESSLWYDSSGKIVYVVGDTGTASRNVVLQRGVVDPVLKTISWAASDSTLQTSLLDLAGKNSFISMDTTGRLWVLASNLTNLSPIRVDLTAFRSVSADSISSWTYSGNMLAVDSFMDNVKGVIVPAGSGNSVWTVYAYEGNVAARKYTGSWSAQTDIYVRGPTESMDCTNNSAPSAVVDASGVIHVVYGDGHKQPSQSKPFIYYVYNSGSGWQAPYRLDSVGNTLGNKYPTISLDESTGDVYAFWVQTDTSAVPRTIMCSKNVGGAWQSVTIGGQTNDPKYHLTSVYSAPEACLVGWQWTQNSSAPIQVLFDKIPEFDSVFVPIFLLLVVAIAFVGRSRGRGRP